MISEQETIALAEEIRKTKTILTALGDEVRQHLILVMLQSPECSGLRVLDIAAKTNLSRPAVSHHLQILKNAGIVQMRREGTKNYYYFDAADSLSDLIHMLTHAKELMCQMPDRSGEEQA